MPLTALPGVKAAAHPPRAALQAPRSCLPDAPTPALPWHTVQLGHSRQPGLPGAAPGTAQLAPPASSPLRLCPASGDREQGPARQGNLGIPACSERDLPRLEPELRPAQPGTCARYRRLLSCPAGPGPVQLAPCSTDRAVSDGLRPSGAEELQGEGQWGAKPRARVIRAWRAKPLPAARGHEDQSQRRAGRALGRAASPAPAPGRISLTTASQPRLSIPLSDMATASLGGRLQCPASPRARKFLLISNCDFPAAT